MAKVPVPRGFVNLKNPTRPLGLRLPRRRARRMVRGMHSPGRFVRSAVVIGVLTLGSRLLGLAREAVLGYFFSTSEVLSAFRIAFMVPNLARRLFGEGALSSALVPVLTDCLHTQGETTARRLVGTILTLLIVVLAAGVVGAEVVIAIWRHVQPDQALDLSAILLPYMVLICVVAVVGGVLNVRERFAAPAAAPMLLNLGIIIAAVGGATLTGRSGADLIRIVCAGVLAAGVAQLLFVGFALTRARFTPIFGGDWRGGEVRAVVGLMLPMVVGLSAVQINTLADYLMAYVFVSGEKGRVGPAVLGYAQFLYQLPLGVFGIALATAIFPTLSRSAAEADHRGLADTLAHGMRLSLFIALPASVGLVFVAVPAVATIYEHGAFDAADTQRVAASVAFYAAGLGAYALQHVLVRAFYALKDGRTPARIAMMMVVVNVVLNLMLVFRMEERGLALATAVSAGVQVTYLAAALRRKLPEIAWRRVGAGAAKTAAATGCMAAALVPLVRRDMLGGAMVDHTAIHLAALMFVGVVTYGVAAWALGMEELRMVLRRRVAPHAPSPPEDADA
ncbi:MAG: murein biosynthesis integral membrane protein MurJ [Phycisphaerae bacterium]